MKDIIGGMFPLEKPGNGSGLPLLSDYNSLFLMSGRCALYASLLDLGDTSPKRAYVPAYTCETVLSAYHKAGYELLFYDIDPDEMTPVFKEEVLDDISVLGLCGYFGFCRYDRAFLKKCHDRNISVIFDITHSPFTDEPLADYQAGSLRKWMGVAAGGVAIKRNGRFSVSLLPPEKEHMDGRYRAMQLRAEALESGNEEYDKKASEVFWDTELRLRSMFGAYAGDSLSENIIRTYDFASMIQKRRDNYASVLKGIRRRNGFRIVFDSLRDDDVPSHFTVYADDRDSFRSYLAEHGISSTVYWPKIPESDAINGFDNLYPGASFIYDHVCSIQIDQRYGKWEMEYLASVLTSYSR